MSNNKEKSGDVGIQHELAILIHMAGSLPLILLIRSYNQNELGFNPIEAIMGRTGRTAVGFLLLSLAITPFSLIFKLPTFRKLRKPFGLYAALYAGLHFATFAVLDYGLNWGLIWTEIVQKPFIWLGAAGLLILLVLALTSFRWWQRKLGRTWTFLHQLVYLAGILIIAHYLLAVKGDFFSFQGDYTLPIIAGSALLILLLLRLPILYKPLRKLADKE